MERERPGLEREGGERGLKTPIYLPDIYAMVVMVMNGNEW